MPLSAFPSNCFQAENFAKLIEYTEKYSGKRPLEKYPVPERILTHSEKNAFRMPKKFGGTC